MPLQGRNWVTLLKVLPGANAVASTNGSIAFNGREYTSTGYADFRINGKNPGQTQVNLDGGSIVDQGSDAKTTVTPSLESIEEISVLANNFQAQYGYRGGRGDQRGDQVRHRTRSTAPCSTICATKT